MKRTLLFAALLGGSLTYAQQQELLHTNHDYTSKGMLNQTDLGVSGSATGAKFSASKSSSLDKAREDVYSFVQIGSSYYDLQTNASVGRRTYLHEDGNISAVWTFSPDGSSGFPSRGTAYNEYDGSNWGAFPSARVENDRTGWPSIVKIGDGSLVTFGHRSTLGGLLRATKADGSSTWTTTGAELTYTDGVPIWNRAASNGDTVHVLTNFWSDGGAVPDMILRGVTNPTTYSRSFDGGLTWVDEHIFLPGYDSSIYESGGGDNYAIDVKGSTVAVVIGGVTKDLALWKSTDNGNTWTKTVALAFPYPAYEWGSRILPQDSNYITTDGAMDVLIDNNGNCHIVSGLLGVYDEDTTDDGIFLPNFFNLYHWSETDPTWKICGTPIDMDLAPDPNNPNSRYTFASETTASLGTDGQPPSGLSYAARYGRTSISTHPSLSVDANNVLYVTFDAPLELILHDYGANLRDVHVAYSTDGGATWAETQNASQWRDKEAVFASQSRNADDFIHFIFQVDNYPGTHQQNNGNTGLHPNDEVGIYYAAIPTEDIRAGNLGSNNLSVEPRQKDAKVFVVSQNYPNPFDDKTSVIIYMRSGSDLSMRVTNVLGQTVLSEDLGYKSAGNHQIEIDGSELEAGIYFYTLRSGDHEVTRRMKVVH